ncbi:MAG: S-adenosylmethionine:tRNA ribosyltransferase-isomerase [Bacteroidota bacterium]
MLEYDYVLPTDKIAEYPLKERHHSKLLVLDNNKEIKQDNFKHFTSYLPENSLLVFNNTKVMYARLLFQKENSGARIEIFCLEPVFPTSEITSAFHQTGSCRWKCMVGNSKKWKSGKLSLSIDSDSFSGNLWAENLGVYDGAFLIEFSWSPTDLTFSHILEETGKIPLPPYIKRETKKEDIDRYQTIYANPLGSVAAPTAGLHFTDEVLDSLRKKNISTCFLTLHVGAGTFKPVDSNDVAEHIMHSENIIINKEWVEMLLENIHNPVIAVGTTSVRTLESVYWIGYKLYQGETLAYPFRLEQWYPYHSKNEVTAKQALEAILKEIKIRGTDTLNAYTQLIIIPSYRFRIVNGIITNFHQPRSTLLLLVSAFIGEKWKEVYNYALENNFRFLSYGDACLFLG